MILNNLEIFIIGLIVAEGSGVYMDIIVSEEGGEWEGLEMRELLASLLQNQNK